MEMKKKLFLPLLFHFTVDVFFSPYFSRFCWFLFSSFFFLLHILCSCCLLSAISVVSCCWKIYFNVLFVNNLKSFHLYFNGFLFAFLPYFARSDSAWLMSVHVLLCSQCCVCFPNPQPCSVTTVSFAVCYTVWQRVMLFVCLSLNGIWSFFTTFKTKLTHFIFIGSSIFHFHHVPL